MTKQQDTPPLRPEVTQADYLTKLAECEEARQLGKSAESADARGAAKRRAVELHHELNAMIVPAKGRGGFASRAGRRQQQERRQAARR